jgi:hypothetical protein
MMGDKAHGDETGNAEVSGNRESIGNVMKLGRRRKT